MVDIKEIMELIPHRYPFLLLDRVLEFEENKKIVTIKNVTINEPFFQGHFPGEPIMPGVLIVEAMGQAGGFLVASMSEENQGALVYFMGFDKVRFRKPVVPGDQLRLEVEILKERKKAIKLAGIATVDDTRVAEAEFMATFGEKT